MINQQRWESAQLQEVPPGPGQTRTAARGGSGGPIRTSRLRRSRQDQDRPGQLLGEVQEVQSGPARRELIREQFIGEGRNQSDT